MEWLFDKEIRDTMMMEIIAHSLAAQVVALRVKRGMTQQKFADYLGWTQSQVARYETATGMKHVALKTLLHIAHKCNVALLCRFVDWMEFFKAYEPLLPPSEFNQDRLQALSSGLNKLATQ